MPLDLMQVYQSFRGGQDAARQNRLADMAEQARMAQGAALTGNKQALQDLAPLDPQAYVATKGHIDQQKKADTQEFLGAAYAAQTPEQWKMVVDRFRAKGHQFDPGEDDFANRDTLLRQGMTVADQMGIDLKGKEFAAEQAKWKQQFGLQQSELSETKRYHDAQIGLEDKKLAQPTPTDDMREYAFYTQQTRAAGGAPLPFNDWMAGMKRAGASQVNVGGGSDKQIFDTMNESAVSARSAMTGLNSLKEAKKAIAGGAITGAWANERLALQKIGAWAGVADPTKIVNTETFRSAIAPQVAALMKATVGSTQISNADREFAEKAAGGSINLDEKSITRLIDIMERAGTAVIQGHGERLNKVYPEGQNFDRERALFGVDTPTPPPASNTDADPLGIR